MIKGAIMDDKKKKKTGSKGFLLPLSSLFVHLNKQRS